MKAQPVSDFRWRIDACGRVEILALFAEGPGYRDEDRHEYCCMEKVPEPAATIIREHGGPVGEYCHRNTSNPENQP